MAVAGKRRLRIVAKRVPGLPMAYRAFLKRAVLRRGRAVLDYADARIQIHVTTESIVHSRLRPVAKEPWTVDWIERWVRPDDVLYDIGANIGAYSLIAAKLPRGGCRVVAIEPGYANFASLCDNILLNGLAESVMPFPVALADRTHLGSLSYRSTSAGAAIHALDADQDGVYRQPILVYALDDLVERFSLPAPTLIKLDVDGGESAVLDGAPRILADPRLRSVIAEIEIAQTDAVTSTLAGFGLELAARFNDRHGEPLPGLWYGVFTRPE